VHIATAEVLEVDMLAGDHTNHLGARDEHVTLAGHDEDEVGDGR
jgi:hypothetical protein